MGMIDVQRNHATMFNIRLGEKVKTRNGKDAPARLKDKLRVTSPNRQIVDAFVKVYGGSTQKWEEGWESYLPTTEIRIMLLPGQSITQWWESYKGGVCERRCEGRTEDIKGQETISGKECMCIADMEERICKPMTRLNFLCPDVETLGAGSLVTHSRIAAETLPQEVMKADIALKAGKNVPAVLRAVQRTGKNRQYVVPQIEVVGVSYLGLSSGEPVDAAALPAGGVGVQPEPHSTQKALPASQVEPSAPTSAVPAGEPASVAMRQTIQRQGALKQLTDEQLEELVLEATSKYLDEPTFTVDDGNKVLDAIRAKS